jgi:hypothetical protein
MALEGIITRGQTGADQAGWRAARQFGIPTGGSMPRGFLTEAGPCPEFAELYRAVELETADYPARTKANVRDSDMTLWFGRNTSSGAACTLDACAAHGKRFYQVFHQGTPTRPSYVSGWIAKYDIRVLNVAGHRESKMVGIGDRVERFLCEVFRQLGLESHNHRNRNVR